MAADVRPRPAKFEPALVLMRRHTIPICEYFGWTPRDVNALLWWEFEDAIEYVEHSRRRPNG